jgi:hypothetical protein
LQHYFGVLAQANIDLYCEDGPRAFERVRATWPDLVQSMSLRVRQVGLMCFDLRARAALAAAAAGREAPKLVRLAEEDAKRVERRRLPMAQPMAGMLYAGVANLRGQKSEAIGRLTTAAAQFDALDMRLFAAAARRRLGELMEGGEGAALTQAADAQMNAETIRNPLRWISFMAPGYR